MTFDTWFWKPRGDVHAVSNDDGTVALDISLARYGSDGEIWDLDHFNPLPYVALQCIVESWAEAVYITKDGGSGTTRGHPSWTLP